MTVSQQTTDTNEMTKTILTYPTDLTHPFFNGKTTADIETLYAIINTATPFTADEPADEWENDELCLELNHGFCVMEGRHADTNDADWELFIRATETDEYTEELYVELQTRLAARTDDEEVDVDDRDAPNILPYKKCSVCGERKSCGNYRENCWFCENCYEVLCADCGDAIPDTENLDKCWTNDGETFWCEGCRESHVEEYIRERDGDEEAEEKECDCCGENFEDVCLTIAEDAEGEEEKYCATCLLLKIEDGCVWKENGIWVC